MTSIVSRRFALVGTLALLPVLIAFGAAQGQVGTVPGVWKCPKCGAVLGAGATSPQMASCPLCRVQFAGEVGPQKFDLGAKMPAPPFNNPLLNRPVLDATPPPSFSSLVLVIGLGALGVVLLVGGAIMVTIALCTPARGATKSLE
jgi:hypothetical protein